MIHFALVDHLLIGIYFVAVMVIGLRASRKREGGDAIDFLLAGRSLTLPVFVMTLVSTWYGGILGVGEFSYRYGISNWALQGAPYYVFAAVFALILAPRVRAAALVTIPDKLHLSYGRPAALLGAILTFLLMTPAPYVLMLAVLLQLVTGWSLPVCLVAGTAAAAGYLLAGGFRSDVQTDILEFFLMFVGIAVILPFAYYRFGGMEFLSAHLPPLHLTWHGGNPPQFIIVWFLIALWTLVDPSFHQRCAAARTGAVARNGILVSILFWFLFDAMTAMAGLYARAILPPLDQPVMAFPLLAEAILPAGMKGLFFVGMLATIMSTLNTLVFVGGTTLGRDLVGRWLAGSHGVAVQEASGRAERRRTRVGVVVTAVLSVVLALLIPSVITLWYTIGTAVVPGLLMPLVTSYFPRLRVGGRSALVTMLAGWTTSTLWLLAGWSDHLGSADRYPFGIEPMIPGLAVSVCLWMVFLMAERKFRKA
jgi:solute:Na+ symporter, SSS family